MIIPAQQFDLSIVDSWPSGRRHLAGVRKGKKMFPRIESAALQSNVDQDLRGRKKKE